jgi:hypothetical protein
VIKEFPKSRICAIDCYDSIENALLKAEQFFKQHNVSSNTRDGRNVLLSFCLKSIDQNFKQIKSVYPKVIFCSKKTKTKRIESFISLYFERMAQFIPFPYCGRFDFNSPDLEFAAENCLKKQKTQRKFKQFTTKIGYKGL